MLTLKSETQFLLMNAQEIFPNQTLTCLTSLLFLSLRKLNKGDQS